MLKFDGIRYLLIAWCIMPNHVHLLLDPKESLAKIVQSWKSYTGRWALRMNAELELDAPREKFWMRDYWDRYIRDQEHFERVVDYIHKNPVKAGLCSRPEDWHWSSAWARRAPARQQKQEKTL
ncbi:REP-associated tyrosine transposase [Microbulbifer halophilus]|uniref:Transposase n=1 Tax=Microbulbifer halophilus TaxID=453963 RepID=A0ABW5EE01_9GAMM|nr:transposase [Microbulbifer halophilus]MCW8127684.1 transposase [Microbulbifer halophilus]